MSETDTSKSNVNHIANVLIDIGRVKATDCAPRPLEIEAAALIQALAGERHAQVSELATLRAKVELADDAARKWEEVSNTWKKGAIERTAERDDLRAQLVARDEAFKPVLDWYDGDGFETDLTVMLEYAVEDLRGDRKRVLELEVQLQAREEEKSALGEDMKQAYTELQERFMNLKSLLSERDDELATEKRSCFDQTLVINGMTSELASRDAQIAEQNKLILALKNEPMKFIYKEGDAICAVTELTKGRSLNIRRLSEELEKKTAAFDAQIVELEKDRERLDWLIPKIAKHDICEYSASWTGRDAIDAARNAEGGEEETG